MKQPNSSRDQLALECFTGDLRTIPIPYPGSYDSLIEQSGKSKITPYYFVGETCPKNQCQKGSLRLTSWLVSRHAVVFIGLNLTDYRYTPVPLAYCELCHARVRVLPFMFLPHKTYSFMVIEVSIKGYFSFEQGLRNAVAKIKGVSPHYSTLHGWLGGLGDRTLDRVPPTDKRKVSGQNLLPPTSAIVAETAKRLDPGLVRRWTETQPEIPKRKYQSEFRRERLLACLKLLLTAVSLFRQVLHPLSEWEQFLIPHFFVAGWSFRSRSSLTAIQLDDIAEDFVLSGTENQLVRMRSP